MRTEWAKGRDYSVVCHTVWAVKSRHEATRAKTLRDNPDYFSAKKEADYVAAQNLVDNLLSPAALKTLQDKIQPERFIEDPCMRRPVVIAPSTASGSNNVIAIWLAHNIGFQLGLGVDRDIFQKEKVGRTGRSAMFRLLNQPEFCGSVTKGREYIIVDDNYTRGGTISSLRSYIESNGGKVISATVLADRDFMGKHEKNRTERLKPHEIPWSISEQTLQGIEDKHGWKFSRRFESEVGFTPECLTEHEGRFVEHFPDQRAFFKAIADERRVGFTPSSRHVFTTASPQAPAMF